MEQLKYLVNWYQSKKPKYRFGWWLAAYLTVGVVVAGNFDNLGFNTNTISSRNTNGDIILDPNGTGKISSVGPLHLPAQNSVRLEDAAGGEYAGIKAPTTIGANYTLTLPDTDGTGDQVLHTDGSGVLSWAADAGLVSLGAVGASPNANSATISGTALNLEPASASFPGVVTTGTQVFAGSKQFAALMGIGRAPNTGALAVQSNGGAYDSAFSLYTSGGTQLFGILPDTSNFVYFRHFSSSTLPLVINNTGKVGINVASPTATLDVKQLADQVQFQVSSNATQTNNLIQTKDTGGTVVTKIEADGDAFFPRMVIGDIGSAPTNASTGLEVNGTSKALLLSRMTNTQRDALTAANGMLLYSTTDEKVQGYQNGTWGTLGGSGQGVPNNITNYNFESNTTGWSTYADAAGTTPVDGLGGSPINVSINRSTTTPLRDTADLNFVKDAANRQGEGVSYDFTINSADKGRVLSIAFDYEIVSGTYASGDVTVYVYDTVNAVLLPQPSANSIIKTGIPSQQSLTTFQTAINSTSYRLIFHVASTSASAYTLAFDNIIVGPQGGGSVGATVTAAFGGDPASATASNPIIFPTSIYDNHAGYNVTTGLYTVPVPGYYNVKGFIRAPTSGVDIAAFVNSVNKMILGRTDSGYGDVSFAGQVYANAGDTISIRPSGTLNIDTSESVVILTLVNGSSQTSANNRLVDFQAYKNGGSITANTTIPTWTGVNTDKVAGFNSSTGVYTVQVPGDYFCSFSFAQTGTTTTNLSFLVNGVVKLVYGPPASNGYSQSTGLLLNLKAGDLITLQIANTLTAASIDNGTVWSMALFNGNQQIARAEDINARYYASSTSINGTLATVVYTTKDFDSHNAVSSSGFTAPAPGKYFVEAAHAVSGTFALNNTTILEVQKNGTAICSKTNYAGGVITASDVDISCQVNASTGDVIRIQLSSSATTPAIVSSNFRNWVSFTRVGN